MFGISSAFKDIVIQLSASLTVILVFVFLLSRARIFKNVLQKRETTPQEKIFLASFFGLIGAIGTYYGLPVQDAMANTRAIGPIVAGLVAGPYVGLGAGLVAGIHRYNLGGFTAEVSALSTILEGFAAGLLFSRIRYKSERWHVGLIAAFILEMLHMALLLIIPKPLEQAVILVGTIGAPMIVINALGVSLFVAIIDSVARATERIEGRAAQLALQIANQTLPYLRKGLTPYSSKNTVEIIHRMVEDVDAVAITSRSNVLGFVGAGSDHHDPAVDVFTDSTRIVLEEGEFQLVQNREEIGCPVKGCPLASKVVVPLKDSDEVIGALVLYKVRDNSITAFEQELARGLALLFSTQLEIGRGEQQKELLAQAEIKALQAQINPHFLFNALNTIVYYCRKQPETARQLLVHLGDFYRNNLSKLDSLVDLQTEINHIDSYLKIEKARFGEKLKVIYEIDEAIHCLVPPLILQPIVENAVKHGVLPKKEGGIILIKGTLDEDCVLLTVEDDGVGMTPKTVQDILAYNPDRRNIGISNVNNRLKSIYGNNYGLRIESMPGSYTRVMIPIPLRKEETRETESIAG